MSGCREVTDPAEVGFGCAGPDLVVELLSEKQGGGQDAARPACSREGGRGTLVYEDERSKRCGEGRKEDKGREAGGTGKSTIEHSSLLSSLQAGKFPNFRRSKALVLLL